MKSCARCGGAVEKVKIGRPRKYCGTCRITAIKEQGKRPPGFSTERVRAWRAKLYADPERYRVHLEKVARRERERKERVAPEQRERELARDRERWANRPAELVEKTAQQIRERQRAYSHEYRAARDKRATLLRKLRRERLGLPIRVKRRIDGLQLECTKCKKMLPRGWFGKYRKELTGKLCIASHCRECIKPVQKEARTRRCSRVVGDRLPNGFLKQLRASQTDQWGQLRCGICKKAVVPPDSAELDHIRPVSKGGRHIPSNVQLAHKKCNRRKSAKYVHGWMFGA